MSQSVTGVGTIGGAVTGTGVSAQVQSALGGLIGNLEGTNVFEVNYYCNTYPFINVLKQCSTNDPCAWWNYPGVNVANPANGGGGGGTLLLDANGYPTSMTGNNAVTYTALEAWFAVNTKPAPGQTSYFPAGPFRFQFTGKGTLQFTTGVASLSGISNTGSGTSTISGNQVVSPTTGVTTFTVNTTDGAGGVRFRITAIPDGANNPRAMTLVQNSNTAAFDAGAIFNPAYLAALNNFTSIRTKDWGKTDREMLVLTFGVQLNIGNTQANMKVWNNTTGVFDDLKWERPTGSYLMTTKNGDRITIGATWGSATITFPALTVAVAWDGTSYDRQCMISKRGDWAHRSKYTDFTWAGEDGVPYEVMWSLCNQLKSGQGVDSMTSFPARVGTDTGIDTTYVDGMINLAHDGTGTTMPGFTGLVKLLRGEFSNEGWNFFQPYDAQWAYAVALAKKLCPGATDTATHEYRGAMQALIGDRMFAIYGAVDFAARCVSSYGGQTAWNPTGGASSWGPYYTIRGMDSTHWTAGGHAYSHHINGLHFAPYVGMNNLNTAEQNAITATADPVDTIFGLAYSATYAGCDISRVSPQGWVGTLIANMLGQINAQAGFVWSNLPIVCYESGTDFAPQTANAWGNLCVSVHYDPRIEYIYYDPQNVLFNSYGYPGSSGQPGYLPSMRDVCGIKFMHQLTDCQIPSNSGGVGEYGLFESVMQPLSPLSVASPKYRGVQKYLLGLPA